ncbi:MAG TPA: ABC transporter permease, partial [Chitinophagaceae bacterium]|nr:ABC transporter permease [Chitinophagaceae bacterium]
MPASNLSIALRQFRKNKGFAALNIIGLAMGIASCLLIVLYVTDERSYDKYNVNADRIYRIDHEVKFGGNHLQLAQAPADLGPEIV